MRSERVKTIQTVRDPVGSSDQYLCWPFELKSQCWYISLQLHEENTVRWLLLGAIVSATITACVGLLSSQGSHTPLVVFALTIYVGCLLIWFLVQPPFKRSKMELTDTRWARVIGPLLFGACVLLLAAPFGGGKRNADAQLLYVSAGFAFISAVVCGVIDRRRTRVRIRRHDPTKWSGY